MKRQNHGCPVLKQQTKGRGHATRWLCTRSVSSNEQSKIEKKRFFDEKTFFFEV